MRSLEFISYDNIHANPREIKSGRGVFFSEGRDLLHFGYKICVVKTLNIV